MANMGSKVECVPRCKEAANGITGCCEWDSDTKWCVFVPAAKVAQDFSLMKSKKAADCIGVSGYMSFLFSYFARSKIFYYTYIATEY